MSRYIDADALIKKIDEQIQMPTFMDCLSAINSAPSIDIVRCKECKYADKCSRNVAMRDTYQMYEKIDFCSYGERREP